MRKRLFPICVVLLVLVVSIAALVTSCTPTERCTIGVKATLDGSPWIGAVQYTLTGPGGSISGDTVPETFSNVYCGNWTCAYVSGGPGGAYLESITPSPAQTVSEGGTITFTLEFKTIPPVRCTIEVKATLCDIPWEGDVQYTLTESGGSPINGTEVPDSFTVDCGNWTCAYVSGGPPGAYLESITPPSLQSVSEGGTITFTLNFELDQDAAIEFVTWTLSGEPVQGSEIVAVPCQIVDVHFRQWVDGCQGYEVAVNETSLLTIMQIAGGPGVQIYVVDDWCALNKTPAPKNKWEQVPSFNGDPVEKGDLFPLLPQQGVTLDVETAWQLVKCLNYTKSINWLGISKFVEPPVEPHPCVLFELLLPAAGPWPYVFTLQASASVELVDDEDVNTQNNSDMGPLITLVVNGP
jgi:hypothetical protein